jgi:GNAT superfamily N-acetyltransferase
VVALVHNIVSDTRDPAAVERLMRALPDWFGIEESLLEYVADAARLPTYLAYVGHDPNAVGVLLLARHFPEAAEVHLMAVDPRFHRRGIGRALLEAVEQDLRSEGVRFLQVKTQGPSRPDPGYQRTLSFYRAEGFAPLEELDGLWAENPCLIMVKSLSP